MGIPRFFRLSKPRQFDHIPIYYDPQKEERENRTRRIKAELGMEVNEERTSSSISRGSFRQYSSKYKKQASRESNRRLLLIVAVLLLLAYLIFY